MSTSSPTADRRPHRDLRAVDSPLEPPSLGLSTAEFVIMVAGLMALNALAIDIMLPALGAIAADLAVVNANDRQLVIIVYVLGFGAPQLFFGPVADRFGRRPTLFVALVGYIFTGIICVWAYRFDLLLVARFAQGVFAAGCRVVAVAVVRDATAGPAMARIMSLVMTVFMVVPILAPSLGQLILFVGPWRWCFGALALSGTVMLVWTAARLPESTDAAERGGQTLRQRAGSYLQVIRHRRTVGYMLAGGCVFGALFGFIATSDQIFREIFHQGDTFALWFAGVAGAMSISNLINARLVMDIGTRSLSHGALIAFVVIATVGLVLTVVFGDRLYIFYPTLILAFMCFGLVGANFNATAMEPLGRIAGTGAAAFGFVTTTGSGLLGGVIGRAYDGTTVPLFAGYVVLGTAALVVVIVTERGRIFRS